MKLMRNQTVSQVNLLDKYCTATGTPGKHVMKFLVQSQNPAQERDYACSLLTALCLSRKHSPECEYKHAGWGDAFSGAIKRPRASACRLSAKSDSTGILCGEQVVWINPTLRDGAAWLLQQPGTSGLVKVDLLGLCLLWLSQARQGQQ